MRSIVFTVTNDLSYDQRMIRTAETLSAAGYTITLVGFVKSASIPLQTRVFKQERIKLFFKTGKLFYIEYNLKLLFWLIRNKFDIYGAVDLDTLMPNFIASKINRAQLTHDAHEYFTELPEIADRKLIKSLWELAGKFLYPRVKHNITVCRSIADELERRYAQPYSIVRNVPFYSFNDTEQANIEGLPILLYQGTLNKGRGLEQLISSMELIPAILNIAGEGDLSNELRKQVEQISWKERVHFLGYQKPEELKKITQKAYIGINLVSNEGLSYYYSLSNKFFDYIMAGIPQVTMSYPEYDRLNNKYHIALTISEIKEDLIINSVNKLLQDKGLYNQLKGNTKLAAEELNWEKEKQELLSFYDKVR